MNIVNDHVGIFVELSDETIYITDFVQKIWKEDNHVYRIWVDPEYLDGKLENRVFDEYEQETMKEVFKAHIKSTDELIAFVKGE